MKKLKYIVVPGLVVTTMAVAFFGYRIFWQPQSMAGASHRQIVISKGSSINTIASILADSGVVENASYFVLAARLSRHDRQLQAGKFNIPAGKNHLEILELLRTGEQVQTKVTIPEGITARHIAGLLARAVEIDSAEFLRLVADSATARELGIGADNLEGYLFPETYLVPWGTTEKEMVAMLVQQFHRQKPDSLEQRAKQLGMTVDEIITLASIIEGEAMLDEERETISAVYHNRLRKDMLLQADPTIQYIIPDGPRRLLHADLAIDSPYNTYRYAGLPPGPINNPGKRSIAAALAPADVPYLYMVARGDGSHVFSRTLAEHNRAHKAFNRYRREVARQKNKQ